MKMITITIVVCSLLVGCATMNFYKPGMTEDQFQMDKAECDLRAQEVSQYWHPGQSILVGGTVYIRNFKACMASKGYRLIE